MPTTCSPIGWLSMKKPRADAFDPKHTLTTPLEGLPAIEKPKEPAAKAKSARAERPADKSKKGEVQPRADGSKTPRRQPTTVSRHHDTMVSSSVEFVRAAVREVGKEAATHRFTAKEKRAVAGIVFTYTTQGIRTSENEIARIGINWLLRDYEDNGEESFLHQTLVALNS